MVITALTGLRAAYLSVPGPGSMAGAMATGAAVVIGEAGASVVEAGKAAGDSLVVQDSAAAAPSQHPAVELREAVLTADSAAAVASMATVVLMEAADSTAEVGSTVEVGSTAAEATVVGIAKRN